MERFDAVISGVYSGNLSSLEELVKEIKEASGSDKKKKIDELKEIMMGFPIISEMENDGSGGSGDKGHVGWKGHKGGSLPKWMRPNATETDFQSALKRYVKTYNKAMITMLLDSAPVNSSLEYRLSGNNYRIVKKEDGLFYVNGNEHGHGFKPSNIASHLESSDVMLNAFNFGDVSETEGWDSYVDEQRNKTLMLSRSEKKEFLEKNKGDELDWLESESKEYLDEKINEYFDIIKESGDYRVSDVEGQTSDIFDSRGEIEFHLKEIGVDEDDACKLCDCIIDYTSGDYDEYGDDGGDAVLSTLFDYIKPYGDPVVGEGGQIYRGVSTDESSWSRLEDADVGDRFSFGRCASWTSNINVGLEFAGSEDDITMAKLIVCKKNKTSIPISCMSSYHSEDEVLSKSDTEWVVVGKKIEEMSGNMLVVYTVVECGGEEDE